MKVFVKTLKGANFQIEVKPEDTVSDVKKNIESVQGADAYPAAQQMLIHQGKVLKDNTTLQENNVAENIFVVIMLNKSKVSPGGTSTASAALPSPAQPASSLPSSVTPPSTTPQAPAPTAASLQTAAESSYAVVTSASSESDTYGQAASNLVAGSNLETTIQQILDMGGGSWDRKTVVRALCAAYNNPERAVEYLYSGIPEQAEIPPVARVPASGEAVNTPTQAQQPAPPTSGGPNANPVDLFPQKKMEQKQKKKVIIDNNSCNSNNNDEHPHDDDEWCWFVNQGVTPSFLSIAVFGLLIRAAVSLHSYSGAGDPPKYGDYEAQRHWMEITLNLPVRDWYRNTTKNDLTYWGLDYPPLTAYQSYVHGIFVQFFHPDSVSLFTSRGYESYRGKLLMRWTVLSSDALIFFTAVLYFAVVYYGGWSSWRKSDIAWHIAVILMNPCLILIDHGHFQYNCISLGLAVGAVSAVLSQNDIVASVLFCLSLNHKQMSAYFAPAFFSHLLGKCLRRKNPLLQVLKLALAVIGTFAIVWWPYIRSRDAFFEVLSRLAPFDRGIYEDYVANFWCTTSVIIKWKRLYTTRSLKCLSLVATVLTCLPSMVQQILAPSSKGFLYGLLNSSFAFYFFSFQVHEKSVLLPLLPATLLAMELPGLFPMLLMHYALFSMFPLLCRDKLIVPYIALYALFILLYLAPSGRRRIKMHLSATRIPFSMVMIFPYLCSIALHVIYLTIHPPEKYPFLFEAMIMLLCFSQFLCFVVYTNAKQWKLSRQFALMDKDKKLN